MKHTGKQIEIWTTDGTPAGTVKVRALTSVFSGGINFPFPEMARVGDRLFVGFYTGSFRHLFWKSDGTSAGTSQVKMWDWWSFFVPKIFELGNLALFPGASDGIHGGELMASDGTATGSIMVKDIAPGSASSSPFGGAVLGPAFYFAAQNADYGRELWRTDGTETGTVLVEDIAPGPTASNPSGFVVSGGRLFFTATTNVTLLSGTVGGTGATSVTHTVNTPLKPLLVYTKDDYTTYQDIIRYRKVSSDWSAEGDAIDTGVTGTLIWHLARTSPKVWCRLCWQWRIQLGMSTPHSSPAATGTEARASTRTWESPTAATPAASAPRTSRRAASY